MATINLTEAQYAALGTAGDRTSSCFVPNRLRPSPVDETLESIFRGINELGAWWASLEAEIEALEAAGLADATLVPEYRQGGDGQVWGPYYRLVYPVDNNGNRRREYVGINPASIAAARGAIDRSRRHEALKEESSRLRETLRRVQAHLDRARETLENCTWLQR